MDPLHLTIALGPLAVYFLILGMINLSPRPFVTTGGRDMAALGVAVSGFVIAGPMELLLPEAAIQRFQHGWIVWLLMIGMYALVIVLIALMARPRLVIYNITEGRLKTFLERVASTLDKQSKWAGGSVHMPGIGVQAHIEAFSSLKNVQIRPSGPRQNYAGWRQLEAALAWELKESTSPTNPYGFSLLLFAGLMLAAIIFSLATGRQELAQAMANMLRW